jgi:hypothetical protein
MQHDVLLLALAVGVGALGIVWWQRNSPRYAIILTLLF